MGWFLVTVSYWTCLAVPHAFILRVWFPGHEEVIFCCISELSWLTEELGSARPWAKQQEAEPRCLVPSSWQRSSATECEHSVGLCT